MSFIAKKIPAAPEPLPGIPELVRMPIIPEYSKGKN